MKNSQKGFVVPLLIAIIALLVIGGSVYVYETKKAEAPVVVDTGTQQTNTQTSLPANMQTDISNWKTYQNEQYGIKLKYPSDWSLTLSDDQLSLPIGQFSTVLNLKKE